MKKLLIIIFFIASVLNAQNMLIFPEINQELYDASKHVSSEVISYFDGGVGTEWIKTDGDSAIETSDGIRLVSTNGFTIIEKTLDTPLDMSNAHIMVSFYYPAGANAGLRIYLYDGADYFNINNLHAYRSTGWNEFDLPISRYSFSGTPDWTNITKIRIRSDVATSSGVTFRSITKVNHNDNPEGIVVFTFDDSPTSQYTYAYPYLSQYGYTGTIFRWHDGEAGTMTIPQLQELKSAGWEIGGHGYTNLTTLTLEEVEADVTQSKELLISNNLKSKYMSYAYPGGAYNSDIKEIVSANYSYGRTINNFNSAPFPLSQLLVNSHSLPYEMTVDQVKAAIDQAETNKELCILAFHLIDVSAGVGVHSVEQFGQIIDYAHSKNVRILNFTKAVMGDAGISGQHLPLTPTLTSAVGTAAKITLNISSSVYDSIYIYRDTVTTANPTTCIDTIPKSATYEDLTGSENGIYNYRIRTHNLAGFSNYSDVKSDTVEITPVGVPSDFTVTGTYLKATLGWTNAVGSDSVKIYVNTSNDSGTATLLTTVTGVTTTYKDSSALYALGSIRYYWLKSLDGGVLSDFSLSASDTLGVLGSELNNKNWANRASPNNFETFVSNGDSCTMVNNAGGYGFGWIVGVAKVALHEYYQVTFNMTLNSGTMPTCAFYKAGVNQYSGSLTPSAGFNTLIIPITAGSGSTVIDYMFTSGNVATNFQVHDVSIKKIR